MLLCACVPVDTSVPTSSIAVTTSGSVVTPTTGRVTSTSTIVNTTTTIKPSTATSVQAQKKPRFFMKDWLELSKEEQAFLQACQLAEGALDFDTKTMEPRYKEGKGLYTIGYSEYVRGDYRYQFVNATGEPWIISNLLLSRQSWENPGPPEMGPLKTEEELRAIATQLANMIYDIQMYSGRDEQRGTGETLFEFYRCFNEYRTTEDIVIKLRHDGTVKEISKKKIGLFEKVEVPVIDEQKLQQKCFEKMKIQLAQIASARGARLSSVTIKKMFVDIKDGKEWNGYYEHSPEIENGQMSILADCIVYFSDGSTMHVQSTALLAKDVFSDTSDIVE